MSKYVTVVSVANSCGFFLQLLRVGYWWLVIISQIQTQLQENVITLQIRTYFAKATPCFVMQNGWCERNYWLNRICHTKGIHQCTMPMVVVRRDGGGPSRAPCRRSSRSSRSTRRLHRPRLCRRRARAQSGVSRRTETLYKLSLSGQIPRVDVCPPRWTLPDGQHRG